MTVRQTLKANGEADIARTHDVLNLELTEASFKSKLLNNAGIFSTGETTVVFTFRTCDDHLPRGKNKCCRLWFTNTHNNGRETLRTASIHHSHAHAYLRVVFSITRMQRDGFKIESSLKIHGGDNISKAESVTRTR